MPDTRAASRAQKRKRQLPPALAGDPHTKKKRKQDSNAQPSDTPPAARPPRPIHAGNPRAEITDFAAQTEQQDWRQLIDRILQELMETFGGTGSDLPMAVERFLCDLLSAILLRSYRAYSLEKLFGHGNSGPQGAVKVAIERDNQEMSFEAVTEFADQNGYRRIENVKGNRSLNKLTSGREFFDCVWGDYDMSRTHWDTADFHKQYQRICREVNKPGPAGRMLAKFKRTLEYRFFQSQTVFSYPDGNNGTFASTGKSSDGGLPSRKL
ncbi:hypothetical protein LA080_002634 [Diaporthe eres]|nr:hypothetical protein LA080_002634 [Diaporthe eres]